MTMFNLGVAPVTLKAMWVATAIQSLTPYLQVQVIWELRLKQFITRPWNAGL